MRDLAIYGGGGFGREVACLINNINEHIAVDAEKWNLIGFFDDVKQPGSINEYGVFLGGIDALNNYDKPLSIVLAIGSPKVIHKLTSRITNPLISFPNIIAPNVLFFDRKSTELGQGNIITFGCRLSCNTKLGNFNILNGNVSFGHDAAIGDFNVLMPETRLSGNVATGDMNLFGARSFVVQQTRIGNNTTIGAGAVVFRNTKDGFLYLGNPAKKVSIL